MFATIGFVNILVIAALLTTADVDRRLFECGLLETEVDFTYCLADTLSDYVLWVSVEGWVLIAYTAGSAFVIHRYFEKLRLAQKIE